jgi:hypothetical protein
MARNASNWQFINYTSLIATYVSILSGEILRLRERYGDPEPERDLEGLLEMYLEPVEFGVPLRDPDMLLRMGLLLLLRLRSLSWSLLPSIASSSRLLRGPRSPTSSKI